MAARAILARSLRKIEFLEGVDIPPEAIPRRLGGLTGSFVDLFVSLPPDLSGVLWEGLKPPICRKHDFLRRIL